MQLIRVRSEDDLRPLEGYAMRPVVIDGNNIIHSFGSRQATCNDIDDAITFLCRLASLFNAADCPRLRVVVSADDIFSESGDMFDPYRRLYAHNQLIAVPPEGCEGTVTNGVHSSATEEVARIYGIDPRRLQQIGVSEKTFAAIADVFTKHNGVRHKVSGKRQLPLDDLVVVFEAILSGGVIVSCDKFRDVSKYISAATVNEVLTHRRLEAGRENWDILLTFPGPVQSSIESPLYVKAAPRSLAPAVAGLNQAAAAARLDQLKDILPMDGNDAAAAIQLGTTSSFCNGNSHSNGRSGCIVSECTKEFVDHGPQQGASDSSMFDFLSWEDPDMVI